MDQTNDKTPIESNDSLSEPGGSYSFDASIAMPEVGQKIGPNRILELIAEGGMANVYKVWHEGLEIVRAIKILKPGFNEESKQRLQTEAKISAHLRHPNIVEIYGVNFWNDSVPYLEMEFIDGFSVKDLLKYHKNIPYTFVISLGHFVCNALNYAHNQVFTLYGKNYQGVVHRDIKPANILISRTGVVKLADFGIAKPTEISLHTVGQKVMGTFSYLSPEQLNGAPLDCRCDIYSLGTVLYEIVTGVKAFPQKVMSELIQKKMTNEYRPLHSFGCDCPKQLCSIIDKSMELAKEKRFESATEFDAELINLLNKSTKKTPEQLVSEYLKNPKATSTKISQKKSILTPFSIAVSIVLVLCLLIVSICLFSSLRHNLISRFNGLFEKSVPSAVVPGPAKDASAQNNASQPVPPSAVKSPLIPAVRDSSSLAVTEEKPRRQPAQVDPLKAALNAVRARKYKEAIPRLEILLGKQLPDSLRSTVIVNLLDSYLATNSMDSALKVVSGEFVNDGYFYFLCGKTYFVLGKYERAAESFGNAQTVASKHKNDLMAEATYWWAKSLDETYQVKPNSENKHACIRAWQKFTGTFCGDSNNSEHCKDAQDRAAVYKN